MAKSPVLQSSGRGAAMVALPDSNSPQMTDKRESCIFMEFEWCREFCRSTDYFQTPISGGAKITLLPFDDANRLLDRREKCRFSKLGAHFNLRSPVSVAGII